MKKGYFGEYGGSFVSKAIQAELNRVEKGYNILKKNKDFIAELNELRANYQGRPTPLYYCKRLTENLGGAKIYLKREDLNHTGAHKINHCLGEALLARYLGKKRIIAETGAGQHGLAIATACALLQLECEIHMGEIDVAKQKVNVDKMKLLGAEIVCVTKGERSLKEAVDSAFESYERQLDTAIYCIGSVVGPHPFPTMVRDFQSIVGKEVKKQAVKAEKRLPDYVVACVGGGSNAMGIFYPFIRDTQVKLIGVEAKGRKDGGDNSASIAYGKTEVFQGFKSKVLLDDNGNALNAYSIASGLDYPAVGPEHAYLNQIGRAEYTAVTDEEAVDAFYTLTKTEGIFPALESAHAVAQAIKMAPNLEKDKVIVVNLSGRGDKDIDFILQRDKK